MTCMRSCLTRVRSCCRRDDSYTGDIQAEIEAYRRNLLGRGRRQEFDDALDDATPGEIGGVRRQMRREDKGVRVRSEVGGTR